MALEILIKRATWYTESRIRLMGEDNSDIVADAALDVYAPIAERIIKRKKSDYTTIITNGGDDLESLIDAVICQICAMFTVPLRNLLATDVKLADIAEKKKLDFDKMETAFYQEVGFLLNQISTATPYLTGGIRAGVVSQDPMFESIPDGTLKK